MTRAELLEQLIVERFGPIPRPRTRRPTPAEVTDFELSHERALQRLRRNILESHQGGTRCER